MLAEAPAPAPNEAPRAAGGDPPDAATAPVEEPGVEDVAAPVAVEGEPVFELADRPAPLPPGPTVAVIALASSAWAPGTAAAGRSGTRTST